MIINELSKIPFLDIPCGLTIGSFDGVHLGHQFLLKHLRSRLPSNSKLAVFTFSNHPSYLFSPDSPVPLICTPAHKALLLKKYGADITTMVPFTKEFSQTPFEEFLTFLKKRLQFSVLVLGVGASFGKNREGDEDHVQELSKKLQFTVEYLPKYQFGTHPVSSGRVRIAIGSGNFAEAARCLGRPYSVLGDLIFQNNHYTIDLPGICLPPDGKYPIRLKVNEMELSQSNLKHLDFEEEPTQSKTDSPGCFGVSGEMIINGRNSRPTLLFEKVPSHQTIVNAEIIF